MANTGCTGFFEIVNSNIYVAFASYSNYDMTLRTDLASQRLFIGNGSNCVAGIVLNSNYVGINTITPKYPLDVGGNIHGTSNLYLGSNVGVGYSNYPTDLSGNTGNIITSGNICAGNLGMFRNRIINGDMRINQRGVTSLVNIASKSSFCVDRIYVYTAYNNVTIVQNTLSTNDAPCAVGLQYSLRLTTSGNQINNLFQLGQNIEGYNISDFKWGTPYASPVTLSFWFKSNIIAKSPISICLRNAYAGSSWITYITNILSSTSWTYYTITIPGCTIGTWNANNLNGLELLIGNFSGVAAISTTDTWGNYSGSVTSTTSVRWDMTANNYIEFTGLQLEKGTIATPFESRPYSVELQLCQRYFVVYGNESSMARLAIGNWYSSIEGYVYFTSPVDMRIIPSLSSSNNGKAVLEAITWYNITSLSMITAESSNRLFMVKYTISSGVATNGVVAMLGQGAIVFFSAEL